GEKVDEGQGMVRISHGPAVLPQRQPANAAMVVLHEFPIRLLALLLAEDEILLVPLGLGGLMPQMIEVGWETRRTLPVGPAGDFHLQYAQIHAQLQGRTAVAAFEQPGLNHAGFELPALQGVVDMLGHDAASSPSSTEHETS